MKARHINDRQFATQLNFLQASIGQPHWPATSRSPQPATVAAESNRAEPGALARGTAKLAHLVGVGVDRLRQHASLAKARRELGRLPDHYLEDIGFPGEFPYTREAWCRVPRGTAAQARSCR